MKKKIIAGLAATAVIAAPLAITAPAHAYAGTPGCVTLTEYRSITHGMTQRQVANRFGTKAHPYWGKVTWTWDSDYSKEIDREYKRCSNGKPVSIWEHGGVEVDFENESDWDTGEFYGPLLSTYKYRSAY